MRSLLGLALLVVGAAVSGPVMAQTPADYESVRNHVTCYPFGIDKIGRGDADGGKSIWNECFASDFQFSLFFGRGEPLICPGAKCSLPASMNSVEMRAAVAKKAFELCWLRKNFAPSHECEYLLESADRAIVNASLQAWHWKADGVVLLAAGTWDVEVVRTAGKWRIAKESLSIVGSGTLSRAEPMAVVGRIALGVLASVALAGVCWAADAELIFTHGKIITVDDQFPSWRRSRSGRVGCSPRGRHLTSSACQEFQTRASSTCAARPSFPG